MGDSISRNFIHSSARSHIFEVIAHGMSSNSTPISRRRGHSSRKSQSSTPAQSQVTGTPRAVAARLQENGNAVASSSPMFFSSSPASGSQSRRNRPGGMSKGPNDLVISSPPRQSSNAEDQENTPRAGRQAAGGESRSSEARQYLTTDRIFACTIRPKFKPGQKRCPQPIRRPN